MTCNSFLKIKVYNPKFNFMLKKILMGLVIVGVFSGCLKGDHEGEYKCEYDACAVKAPAGEIQQVQDYLLTNNIIATQHCSGVYYAIDSVGTGKAVTSCGAIVATYKGSLADGTIFDQGQFNRFYALSGLLKGWTNTIPLIKEGGRIRLYIPPSLGYGNTVYGTIPANSVLVF